MTILELKELLILKREAMPKRITKKEIISIGGYNYNYLVLTKLVNLLVKIENCTCTQEERGVMLISDKRSLNYRICPVVENKKIKNKKIKNKK